MMGCNGCTARRGDLVAAGKALRAGQRGQAVQHAQTAAKSLNDDVKAFARGLKARLARR